VEFRILGPLEVVGPAGEALALGSAQQRAVLALLLIGAPEPVSRDRLVDELWGERPPATAQHAVQVYVSGIRKILRAGGGGVAVRGSRSGYVLEVDPERVDARRFERLLSEAQRVLAEDPSRARELFRAALGLWRGPPLGEFSQFEFARAEADRLEELRAVAVEGQVEARLACGEHDGVIGTLTALLAGNPLRERPRRLLMLALYRGGRHAEALAAYRDACAALDEIGLQPGPELRKLEQAILRHDESLIASSAGAGVGSSQGDDADRARSSTVPSGDFQVAGPVTMLFTDIEGSTRMLDRLWERYSDLLSQHHRVMREAIAACSGREVLTAGDSFFAVFSRAADAVDCAQRVQLRLVGGEWPGGEAPRVRMGIHTGTPAISDGELVGIDVHRAARVMAVAHGGQVLLSDDAVRALGRSPQVRDLGVHRLKDLPVPERLFQLLTPGLEAEFPRLRSLNRSNLPTPATPLVGRHEELASALDLLSREEVRLLTLLGTGGAGKTRLAIEVAGEAVGRYRDGVWIVPLAPIPDRALMVSEVTRVLEIDPVAGEPLEQALVAALVERELLLVLDNFEHLLGAASVVADLLAAAPRVDVLSTSREPLRVSGEHRMEVPPLPLQDAVELFVQRALAVRPELSVDDEDRAAIERICSRLDRLPLALELAAARIAVFGPRALEARLAERLNLPEGPRDLPERQRTLSATIDWSYQLLESADRMLLQSLAPFIGGVRTDSAETIWGPDAIDGLLSLAEKSLLRRREDADREPRLWMLETIREFAFHRLAAEGGAMEAAERHAEHFLAVTEEAAAHLLGREQRRWVERLECDYPNLRAALDHLTKHAPAAAVLMAANLEWFWIVRGYAVEGRRRLAEALASASVETSARAQALAAAGQMALQLGEAAEAEPLLLEALSLASHKREARVVVLTLSHLGWAAEALGDHTNSTARHRQAIAAARAAEDNWALAIALNNCAIMTARLGDLEQARTFLEESLLLGRGIGEPRAIALAANNLAEIALNAGDLENADTLINEALTQAREVDFRSIIASALGTRAVISLQRGDLETATAQLEEAIEPTRSAYDIEGAASLLSVAGTIAAIRHEPLRAAKLWAAADHARARIGLAEAPTVDKLRAQWHPKARAAAPDAASWDAACASGTEISLDDALDFAAGDQGQRQTLQ
jgi:predicted ATPase/class 3 adenylate cyclase/DNA-binding winged helix-turn-helix (wHTH) protein